MGLHILNTVAVTKRGEKREAMLWHNSQHSFYTVEHNLNDAHLFGQDLEYANEDDAWDHAVKWALGQIELET